MFPRLETFSSINLHGVVSNDRNLPSWAGGEVDDCPALSLFLAHRQEFQLDLIGL